MNESYNDFSYVYDDLIDVDYKALCERLLNLCKKYSHKPNLVLDAACGTGNFTKQLVENGLDVIGVDASEDMLSIAREKLQNSCTLICQRLEELDLYGTIDTVFCTLDSLNHITDFENFKKAIGRMALFLEPGGLMLFDVNTVYKHKEILKNNTFIEEKDNIYMVWQNSLCENTVNINIDFFVKDENNNYSRYCENFDERAYSEKEIESVLNSFGLEVLEKQDFFKTQAPNENSEKIIYIVRKGE